MSETEQDAKDAKLAEKQAEVDKVNVARQVDGKNVKGTQLRMGQTRGKNPQIVTWEAFDESKPETLPKDVGEFMHLTEKYGSGTEANMLAWVIDGFNSSQYTAASDPVAEFVDASWPDDIQKNFRMAVKNYSVATGASLQDASDLIKPGIVKALAAKG